MKTRKIILSIVILFFAICLLTSNVYAEDNPAVSAMSGMADGGSADETATAKLGPIINAVIALIQIVGTGIALIMITVLGIKYMIAAPNDKADVKKQIAPMAVGAVILFASVNLVQIIANFTTTTLQGT